jgi:hypothetical protein
VCTNAALWAVCIGTTQGWSGALCIPSVSGVIRCTVEVPVETSCWLTADGICCRNASGVVYRLKEIVGLLCCSSNARLGFSQSRPCFTNRQTKCCVLIRCSTVVGDSFLHIALSSEEISSANQYSLKQFWFVTC